VVSWFVTLAEKAFVEKLDETEAESPVPEKEVVSNAIKKAIEEAMYKEFVEIKRWEIS
jgi:hypothetical protein